jgi:hypothetical protein
VAHGFDVGGSVRMVQVMVQWLIILGDEYMHILSVVLIEQDPIDKPGCTVLIDSIEPN